jgi:hypothetical protein
MDRDFWRSETMKKPRDSIRIQKLTMDWIFSGARA